MIGLLVFYNPLIFVKIL